MTSEKLLDELLKVKIDVVKLEMVLLLRSTFLTTKEINIC